MFENIQRIPDVVIVGERLARPYGMMILACATGPIWEKVWREVSKDLG